MMPADGFPELLLGLSIFGCVVWSFATHVLFWEPLFENVRDFHRAGIAHPQRARLLWLVALTPVIWLLAVIIYLHNVFELWDLMTLALEKIAPNRLIYTILDVYFLFLIFCGIVGLVLTGKFIRHNREELVDLVMIVRFSTTNYHRLADLEEQTTSHEAPSERRVSADVPPRAGASLSSRHSIYSYEVGRMVRVPPEVRDERARRRKERIATQDAKVEARMEEINSRVEAEKKQAEEAAAASSDATGSNAFHHFYGFDSEEDYINARAGEIKSRVKQFITSSEAQADSNPFAGFTDGEDDDRPKLRVRDLTTQPEASKPPTNNQGDSDMFFHIDSDDDPIQPTPSSSASPSTKTSEKKCHHDPDFDELYDVSDSDGCSSCCSTPKQSLQSTRPVTHREPLTLTSPNALTGRYPSDADAELTDAHRKPNLDPSSKRKSGKYVRKSKKYSSSFPTKEHRCEKVEPSERAKSLRAELLGKPDLEKFEGSNILERRKKRKAWFKDVCRKANWPKTHEGYELDTEVAPFFDQGVPEPYSQQSTNAQTGLRGPMEQEELTRISVPREPPYQAAGAEYPNSPPQAKYTRLSATREQPNQAAIARCPSQARYTYVQYVPAYEGRTNNNQYTRPMRVMTPLTISIPSLTLPYPAVDASIPQLFLTNPDPPTPTELREIWPQPAWYYSGAARHPSEDDANW